MKSVTVSKDTLLGVIKTNTKGKASLKGALVSGKYYYKELETLEGYELDKKKHEFNLQLGNKKLTAFDVNKENPLLNKIVKGSVTLTKVDGADEKKLLLGAEFELYSNRNELIGTYVTDSTGTLCVKNLAYGKYYFKEKKAPSGYQRTSKNITFEMTGTDIAITCRNYIVPKLGFDDSTFIKAIIFGAGGIAILGIGFAIAMIFCFFYKKKQH